MSNPQSNDIVSIVFTGKLDNGEVFTTIKPEEPLTVKLGNSDLPPTLEQAIVQMTKGESKKVRLSPDEGYGPRQKDLVQTIDNQKMVDTLKPTPGMLIALKVDKEGTEQKVPATVIEVVGSKVTVDYNHPLAGHHLTYEVTLVDITQG